MIRIAWSITTADAGGPTEFVRDAVNGFVAKDAAGIAAAIDAYADDAELAARHGTAGRATYAEKITAADRELNLDDSLDAWRRVRALSPHIGARGELNGKRVTIWKARLEGDIFIPEVVQPEGRSQMSYDDFVRGLR